MKPKFVFFGMLVILSATVIATGAGYFYVSAVLAETRDKFAQKELELSNSYEQIRYLRNLEASTQELENSLGSLTSIYPEQKLQPQVIAQLRHLASANKVTIEGSGITFPPTQGLPSANSQLSESSAVGGLVGMPVQLTINGNFKGTMGFLEDLENFRRLINVAALEIVSDKSNNLTTNIQIEVLVQQTIKSPAKKASGGTSANSPEAAQ